MNDGQGHLIVINIDNTHIFPLPIIHRYRNVNYVLHITDYINITTRQMARQEILLITCDPSERFGLRRKRSPKPSATGDMSLTPVPVTKPKKTIITTIVVAPRPDATKFTR